jgi:hypothetical protein
MFWVLFHNGYSATVWQETIDKLGVGCLVAVVHVVGHVYIRLAKHSRLCCTASPDANLAVGWHFHRSFGRTACEPAAQGPQAQERQIRLLQNCGELPAPATEAVSKSMSLAWPRVLD